LEHEKNKSEAGAKHRVRAPRLLQAGHAPAQVAVVAGVPRQTVYPWREVLESGGWMRFATRARADGVPGSVSRMGLLNSY